MPHNSQSTPAKRKGIFKKFYALANVASGLDFFMLVRIPFVDNNETRNRQKTWKGKMKYEGYIFCAFKGDLLPEAHSSGKAQAGFLCVLRYP